MSASLVGSEMCIRDRARSSACLAAGRPRAPLRGAFGLLRAAGRPRAHLRRAPQHLAQLARFVRDS
eukprot:3865948-Alexandrium_andersonii.AAC.1